MDTKPTTLYLFLGVCFAVSLTAVKGKVVKVPPANCPVDYRRRVETCIMEAQLAPQAGGGVSLIINKNKIIDLCDRGLLMKTIDCLEEIRSRCAINDTVAHDLDRLYSVSNWQHATRLLCHDPLMFQTNFECLSRSASSVMTCILIRTHTFRMQVSFTSPDNHAKLGEVTCNYAEGIVKCLRGPLWRQCSEELGKMISETMFLLLPPFCLADKYITYFPQPTPSTTRHPTPSPDPTSSPFSSSSSDSLSSSSSAVVSSPSASLATLSDETNVEP